MAHEWHRDPEYRAEWAVLDTEFARADTFIRACGAAGLTQQERAERMNTSQSYIARLEGGKETPSTRTLDRFAQATGHRDAFGSGPGHRSIAGHLVMPPTLGL